MGVAPRPGFQRKHAPHLPLRLGTLFLFLPFFFPLGHSRLSAQELTEKEEHRAQRLMEMIRCPVCESQSVGASTSFLAQEMRNQIRRFVQEGKTDEEILAYYRERYGEEILLVPQGSSPNLLFWGAPFLMFLLGVLVVGFYLYRLKTGGSPARQGNDPPQAKEPSL